MYNTTQYVGQKCITTPIQDACNPNLPLSPPQPPLSTHPPIDEGSDTSWLSSTFRVVILLSLPILWGSVLRRLVERWRSLREMQPSISSGKSVILFLHASKYISCFRLPISCKQ